MAGVNRGTVRFPEEASRSSPQRQKGSPPSIKTRPRGTGSTQVEEVTLTYDLQTWSWKFVVRVFVQTALLWVPFALAPLLAPIYLFYYFRPSKVIRGIRYGPRRRQVLDVYPVPPEKRPPPGQLSPMVVFIPGGAWVVNSRMAAWPIIGKALSELGFVTFVIDYMPFPRGTVDQMRTDVHKGLEWVLENAHFYNADASQCVFGGHSAGAQLLMLVALQMGSEHMDDQYDPTAPLSLLSPRVGSGAVRPPRHGQRYSIFDVRACIGMSGPYDVHAIHQLIETTINVGPVRVGQMVLSSMLGGEKNLKKQSPLHRQSIMRRGSVSSQMPPIVLLHGAVDHTVLPEQSVNFADELVGHGIMASVKTVEGESHNQLVIDEFLRYLYLGQPLPNFIQHVLAHIQPVQTLTRHRGVSAAGRIGSLGAIQDKISEGYVKLCRIITRALLFVLRRTDPW